MPDLVELTLTDGTGVLVEVRSPQSAEPGHPDRPDLPDLPDGTEAVVPVGRGERVVAYAGRALNEVLQPLGSVLDAVQQAVSSAAHPPDEVSVELGFRLSQDLKLGITNTLGEAAFTVSATWKPRLEAG
ncbi:CU044_2847 family protein [Streptomyces coeruleorubidus]|uniref:CU044_2847 family protein n=1 Tax=Streptomyces coeruleorubidus TaxID=116188 RepID=UPI0036C5663D